MMKYAILFWLSLLLVNYACNENEPVVPKLGPKEAGERVILIEELTGVRCPNCPSGTLEIESLTELYPDNIIPVTIHTGTFSTPYPENTYDFRTLEGDAVINLFGGQPLGYPSAVINRRSFKQGTLYLGKTEWGGIVNNLVQEEPAINISFESTYNNEDRSLQIEAVLIPTTLLSGSISLGAFIVESHLIDLQANDLSSTGYTEDYEHNHVLRGYLTDLNGNEVGTNLSAGSIHVKNMDGTIATDWVADNCEVILFVTNDEGEVLQAAHQKIIPE